MHQIEIIDSDSKLGMVIEGDDLSLQIIALNTDTTNRGKVPLVVLKKVMHYATKASLPTPTRGISLIRRIPKHAEYRGSPSFLLFQFDGCDAKAESIVVKVKHADLTRFLYYTQHR